MRYLRKFLIILTKFLLNTKKTLKKIQDEAIIFFKSQNFNIASSFDRVFLVNHKDCDITKFKEIYMKYIEVSYNHGELSLIKISNTKLLAKDFKKEITAKVIDQYNSKNTFQHCLFALPKLMLESCINPINVVSAINIEVMLRKHDFNKLMSKNIKNIKYENLNNIEINEARDILIKIRDLFTADKIKFISFKNLNNILFLALNILKSYNKDGNIRGTEYIKGSLDSILNASIPTNLLVNANVPPPVGTTYKAIQDKKSLSKYCKGKESYVSNIPEKDLSAIVVKDLNLLAVNPNSSDLDGPSLILCAKNLLKKNLNAMLKENNDIANEKYRIEI